MIGDDMSVGEGYLDEKFGELRRAELTQAAATIYVALLGTGEGTSANLANSEVKTALQDEAAKAAVDLFFKV